MTTHEKITGVVEDKCKKVYSEMVDIVNKYKLTPKEIAIVVGMFLEVLDKEYGIESVKVNTE